MSKKVWQISRLNGVIVRKGDDNRSAQDPCLKSIVSNRRRAGQLLSTIKANLLRHSLTELVSTVWASVEDCGAFVCTPHL